MWPQQRRHDCINEEEDTGSSRGVTGLRNKTDIAGTNTGDTDCRRGSVTITAISPLPCKSGCQVQKQQFEILTLTPRKVILKDVETRRKREDKYEERGIKRESKGDKKNSMKCLFPSRRSSSNGEALNDSPLCHDKESSEDVSTLSHRINTNDICLLSGEFGRNRELWYRCIISFGWFTSNAVQQMVQ
jgi:hypothetical protein